MQLPFKLPEISIPDNPGMHLLARLSVKTRLALAFGFVLVLVILTLWLILQGKLNQTARLQSEEFGALLAEQSAENITELVLTNDLLSLNVVLSQLASAPSVTYAAVYNVDQQLIAEAGDARSRNRQGVMRYAAAVDLQDSIVGVLEIAMQNTSWLEQKRSLRNLFLFTALAGILFASVMAVAVSNHLLTPLRRLTTAFDSPLDAGPLPMSSRLDEIREAEVAGMKLLEEHQELLRLESWRNETRNAWRKRHADVSILSIRVADFENSLAILNPSTMTRLLNTCYRLLEQVVELYDGAFFRFTGESILVGFDRQLCASPEFNAVCCGALFQQLIHRQNTKQLAKGSPVLEFKALIHSGTVLVSRTGLQDTSMLTIFGETVDQLLARTDECPAGELVMTEQSRREAVAEYSLSFRLVKELAEDDSEDAEHNADAALHVVTTPIERITPLLVEHAEAILPCEENDHEPKHEQGSVV